MLDRIVELVCGHGGPRTLVGVDGRSGAGKSTFADELTARLTTRGRVVVRSTTDSFHRPRKDRLLRGPTSGEGYYLDSHQLGVIVDELLPPFAEGAAEVRTVAFDEPSDTSMDEVVPTSGRRSSGETPERCPWDALAVSDLPDPHGVIASGRYRRVGRACSAVLREGADGTEILMVRHRSFWTLPGGGINPGERSADAAVRELREETGLVGSPTRELFPGCWLMQVEDSRRISIGTDPELDGSEQALRGVAWFTLEEMQDDRQVRLVIAALGQELDAGGRPAGAR